MCCPGLLSPQATSSVFPACVVTRSQSRRLGDEVVGLDSVASLSPCGSKQKHTDPLKPTRQVFPVSMEIFVHAQCEDASLANCFPSLVDQVEARGQVTAYFLEDGPLLRKWTSHKGVAESWSSVFQIVVPLAFWSVVLTICVDPSLSVELPWSGHLGVTKTYLRVLQNFFGRV